MSKIITIPSSMNEIKKTKDITDGFIIGIKGLSTNVNFYIEYDHLDILSKLCDKDIFIALNKNMHNDDLERVKKVLIELDNYKIKGVLYYDVAVLNIYRSLKLKYDLVWGCEHYATNYNTINYWHSFGVNYTYLSSDITLSEIIDITHNTNSKLMVNLFGYLPMFVSKRHIVKNYLNYFNLRDESDTNYMEKEGHIYPIIDDDIGTRVYSSNILNGIKSAPLLDVDYIVLNSFDIDIENFVIVINLFKDVNEFNALEFEEKINSMFTNTNRGFLDTKTIYRVKKNEK